MALLDGRRDAVWLNIKDGSIHAPYKKEDGTWGFTEHAAIEGKIVDIELVEKIDKFSQKPYKELQTHIKDDKYYILTAKGFKPFADGLLLALANADLTKTLRITPYKGKEAAPGMKASTYCSLRVAGEEDTIKWIENAPKAEYIDNGDGTTSTLRKERNTFMVELVEDLRKKAILNKEEVVVETTDIEEEME